MDEKMRAAIAEVNATRPRTSHKRTLADAALARRVALADARDAYERAVAQAQGDAARAEIAAEKCYAMARARAQDTAARRREGWRRASGIYDVNTIVQIRDWVGLLLSDEVAATQDVNTRPELVAQHRMLADLVSRLTGTRVTILRNPR